MINNEAKVKAALAICLFVISMLIVGMTAFEYGQYIGYEKGYADANQDWVDFLNENLGTLIDMVYQEGYTTGFYDGYLWGYVEGWIEYGTDESFQHPDGGYVP